MRWQTTLIAAILLAFVGGFYYVYEVRLGPEREKAETQKRRVFLAETQDVTAMELKRGTETVKAVRDGGAWQLVEPLKARADRGPVEETITTVTTAKMDREIEAAPKSLADFGLDKPVAEVDLTLKDGKHLTLQLGGKSPTGVWVYAKERDKAAVFVLGESVLRDSTRPVAEFRDKTVLAFSRPDVTGVEIVAGGDTIVVEPDGPRWKMTRPSARPADGDAMGDLLEKLAAARVKEFVAEAPKSVTPYGLDKPLRLSVQTGKEKDRASKTLLLGKTDDAKKGVYAMRAGESSVLLVPEEVWKAVPKNVAVLRDKTVVAFDRDKVTGYEIESPKGKVTVAKDKDGFRITAPEALAADQVEAGAVLTRLAGLRALGFVSDDASGIPKYLAKPDVKITVQQEGAKAPVTLLLASSPDRRGGQPTVYAAVAGRGPVALVDGTAVEQLGRGALDLRDRRLFADLQPKDIKKMRVKACGQMVVLERSGESEWKLIEPSKGTAKSAKAEDLLYMLRALRWEEIAAPNAEPASKWGLDAPTLEVTVYKADGKEAGTVTLGKKDGERYFLRSGGSPVYTIPARALGEIPKVPEDFKG